MTSLNKVMLIGRLTRDPEMTFTPSGIGVCNLGLATNRYSSDANGERTELVDYHAIVVFDAPKRKLADAVATYLHKGSLVYVEGRMQTRSWEASDGSGTRRKTEVIASTVEFLEKREQPSDLDRALTANAAAAASGQPYFGGGVQ